MRGSVAKKLRTFAKKDIPESPWAEYTEVRRSPRAYYTMTVLDQGCQKAWYKTLKKIWKAS